MLIGSGTGAAQDTSGLARIEALLVRPQILCGHFDQSKVLVGLTKPVKSSGHAALLYDDKGLPR